MDVIETDLPEVRILRPRRYGDARGYFADTWNADRMAAAGLAYGFCQDNESLSAAAGTLRGLHYQAPPFAQAKLVRVVRGAVLDVAVDARRGSPRFGRWVSARLTAEGGEQILVPRGFLHGFVTLEPGTLVIYKVDARYDAASDGSVAWDDPDLAIDWGVDAPVLSEKDAKAPRWRDWASPFAYGEAA
jgi:dTDP-4-dehydrorhamnose 3,5-epimerase